MKKAFVKKHKILGLSFAGLTFALAITATGCGSTQRKAPAIEPHYILTGSYVEDDGIFSYYDIGNNELAIGLNETNRTTYSTAIQIPETYDGKNVTGIWHNAFHCNPAQTVRLTNKINTIDFEAFLYSGITTITIPYSVSEIGDAAFYHCKSLTTVTFVNSDQESSGSATECYCDENGDPIGGGQSSQQITYSALTKIPSYCFFKCSAMTTLSLPSSIQEICEEAFNGCYSLNSPIYFQNIKKIRARAFQGCAALRKVYISKTLFTDSIGIEPHAFNYCSTLSSPDNLDIVFCGETATVNTWISNHPNWGWYDDRGNPSTNKYTARIETGDTYFSADWDYTCDPNGDVTITKYNGPTPTAATGWFISVPDHMPSPANNRVIRVSRTTFTEDVKKALKRLYLPKTMVAIENNMFNIWNADGTHVQKPGDGQFNYNDAHGYKNLAVVDDNTKCVIDKGLYDSGQEANIEKRIDLSGLTELEFIGFRAFSGIGGKTVKSDIQKLRLPAKLRAVGDEAFGIFSQRMLPSVDEFTWDYDEDDSILETIGTDCFYGLGLGGSGQIANNSTWKSHTASTIIFPKTFKYFSILGSDKKTYRTKAVHPFDFESYLPEKYQRPSHAFAGCSLLGKVIFKGGAEGDTTNLVIPLQTFVFNESLKTIVFEEREGHEITFHTQQSGQNYAQEAIGGNSGRGENDFRGEPFLQTLVLPNKNTKLRFQKFCFHANSRGAIYLSGELGDNMVSDASGGNWAWITSNGTSSDSGTVASFQNANYTLATQWKTIGDESRFDSSGDQKYWGYAFVPNVIKTDYTNDKSIGTYDINQEMPVYENVHYKETIDIKNTPEDSTDDVSVEVGSGNTREYVENNYCSFVCGQVGVNYVATMTNYLYSLYDDKLSAQKITAHVPETVTAKIGDTNRTCTVNKIGDSAFSACYCDGKDTSPNKTVGNFDDLRAIELPNTIVSIGDYAFTRAYGVTTISSYTGAGSATEGMPSSLTHIGKHAFLFSSVKNVLKIPNECRFYETYPTYPTGVIDDAETPGNPIYKTTSLFSAANDLRRISFWKNGQEVDSSDYYETTTYTSTTAGTPKYTCALYSTNSNDLTYNKDRLLLVLNRDNADAKQSSANNLDATVVTRDGQAKGIRFNGLYKANPYLFGAFKMGYWILNLTCGNPTKNGNATPAQPLISGVGIRSSNNSTMKTSIIYLGKAAYTYEGLACDLDTISGNVMNLPEYGMNGCEKLRYVELPIDSGATIPAGVFANNESTNTDYYVVGDSPVDGTLDLTNSQYAGLGEESFMKNSSIVKFIAPQVSAFTVGSSAFNQCTRLQEADFTKVSTNLTINANAFEGCTSLTTLKFGTTSGTITINSEAFKSCSSLTSIQFSSVTGSITINTSAFQSCSSGFTLNFSGVTGTLSIGSSAFNSTGVTSITWPSANGSHTSIGGSAFNNCDSLTTLTIPSNLSGNLGSSSFAGCNYLTSVTLPSNLTGSQLGTSAFSGDNRLANVTVDGSSIGVTTIGNSTFSGCTALNNIEIDKFTALTSIGDSAFQNTGTLTATAKVTLPSGITSMGASAFKGSSIEIIIIQSSSISLGAECFASCTSLRAVRFTNGTCTWNSYNSGIFNNCTSLTELQLPTGFNLNNSEYNPNNTKYFILGDESVKFYTYTNYVIGSTGTSSGWRYKDQQNQIDDIYFYVSSVQDLLDGGIITDAPSVVNATLKFWTVDASNDYEVIELGTVSSYSGGVVTFSSGITLDSGGFH
ncbi:MAG: leucine-rich repeat protein [Bacilli bacterium]|nr:leucine-rich repeat protein [Bacilli bacterium]